MMDDGWSTNDSFGLSSHDKAATTSGYEYDEGLNYYCVQERIPKGSEGFLRHRSAAGNQSDGEDGGDVG